MLDIGKMVLKKWGNVFFPRIVHHLLPYPKQKYKWNMECFYSVQGEQFRTFKVILNKEGKKLVYVDINLPSLIHFGTLMKALEFTIFEVCSGGGHLHSTKKQKKPLEQQYNILDVTFLKKNLFNWIWNPLYSQYNLECNCYMKSR